MKEIPILILLLARSLVAQDHSGPVILSYTFSPDTVNVGSQSATINITAHVTDSTGVKSAPIVYVQNPANVSATQQTGWFALSSGTPKDGIYTAQVTIPKGAQSGNWVVFSNSFVDSLNNSSVWPVYPTSQQYLVVQDTVITSIALSSRIPKEFVLSQNFPNPFNPTTTIEYTISKSSYVTLKVYDILGREIKTLVDEDEQPGYYHATFSAFGLPSGIYFYRLQAGTFRETKRLTILK